MQYIFAGTDECWSFTAWNRNVIADDVNEALITTCTGNGINIMHRAGVIDGAEIHF